MLSREGLNLKRQLSDFNPLVPGVSFLYPLKTRETRWSFFIFK